jgi:hypothetical protein
MRPPAPFPAIFDGAIAGCRRRLPQIRLDAKQNRGIVAILFRRAGIRNRGVL